jgi:hypothetical protein
MGGRKTRALAALIVAAGIVGCNDESPHETCIDDPLSFWVSFRELDGGVLAAFRNSNEIDISRQNTRVLRGAACAPICHQTADRVDGRVMECQADLAAPITDGGRELYGVMCKMVCE